MTCRLRTSIRQLLRYRSSLRNTFYRRELNTEKREQHSTWHMCNAQYVCMIKLMHQIETLNMIYGLLGFKCSKDNFIEFSPEMDFRGQFWHLGSVSHFNYSNGVENIIDGLHSWFWAFWYKTCNFLNWLNYYLLSPF